MVRSSPVAVKWLEKKSVSIVLDATNTCIKQSSLATLEVIDIMILPHTESGHIYISSTSTGNGAGGDALQANRGSHHAVYRRIANGLAALVLESWLGSRLWRWLVVVVPAAFVGGFGGRIRGAV